MGEALPVCVWGRGGEVVAVAERRRKGGVGGVRLRDEAEV